MGTQATRTDAEEQALLQALGEPASWIDTTKDDPTGQPEASVRPAGQDGH